MQNVKEVVFRESFLVASQNIWCLTSCYSHLKFPLWIVPPLLCSILKNQIYRMFFFFCFVCSKLLWMNRKALWTDLFILRNLSSFWFCKTPLLCFRNLPNSYISAVWLCCISVTVMVQADENEYRLVRDLMRNYDPRIRPSRNSSESLNVTFGLALAQIIDVVSEKKVRLFCFKVLLWNFCQRLNCLFWKDAPYSH